MLQASDSDLFIRTGLVQRSKIMCFSTSRPSFELDARMEFRVMHAWLTPLNYVSRALIGDAK